VPALKSLQHLNDRNTIYLGDDLRSRPEFAATLLEELATALEEPLADGNRPRVEALQSYIVDHYSHDASVDSAALLLMESAAHPKARATIEAAVRAHPENYEIQNRYRLLTEATEALETLEGSLRPALEEAARRFREFHPSDASQGNKAETLLKPSQWVTNSGLDPELPAVLLMTLKEQEGKRKLSPAQSAALALADAFFRSQLREKAADAADPLEKEQGPYRRLADVDALIAAKPELAPLREVVLKDKIDGGRGGARSDVLFDALHGLAQVGPSLPQRFQYLKDWLVGVFPNGIGATRRLVRIEEELSANPGAPLAELLEAARASILNRIQDRHWFPEELSLERASRAAQLNDHPGLEGVADWISHASLEHEARPSFGREPLSESELALGGLYAGLSSRLNAAAIHDYIHLLAKACGQEDAISVRENEFLAACQSAEQGLGSAEPFLSALHSLPKAAELLRRCERDGISKDAAGYVTSLFAAKGQAGLLSQAQQLAGDPGGDATVGARLLASRREVSKLADASAVLQADPREGRSQWNASRWMARYEQSRDSDGSQLSKKPELGRAAEAVATRLVQLYGGALTEPTRLIREGLSAMEKLDMNERTLAKLCLDPDGVSALDAAFVRANLEFRTPAADSAEATNVRKATALLDAALAEGGLTEAANVKFEQLKELKTLASKFETVMPGWFEPTMFGKPTLLGTGQASMIRALIDDQLAFGAPEAQLEAMAEFESKYDALREGAQPVPPSTRLDAYVEVAKVRLTDARLPELEEVQDELEAMGFGVPFSLTDLLFSEKLYLGLEDALAAGSLTDPLKGCAQRMMDWLKDTDDGLLERVGPMREQRKATQGAQ
jgi:hypothetical protein